MKKIAVALTDRHSEGLRMAAGLSLLDDKVDVYLLDNDYSPDDKNIIEKYLKMIKMAGIGLYSNFEKDGFSYVSTKDVGKRFLEYDYVIKY